MKNDFLEGLSSNCMLEKLSMFTEQVQQAGNKQDIDGCIRDVSNVIEEDKSPLFKEKINVLKHKNMLINCVHDKTKCCLL
jgi:hypothetical protein